MEAEAATKSVEVGWSIYEMLAPVVVTALAWISARVSGLIRAKTKNELAAGMLVRLNESVLDAVQSVNQQTDELLRRARHPDSPRGTDLSSQEAQLLKTTAISFVKAYWGAKGLRELAGVLGLSMGAELDDLISSKIEAFVGREKAHRIRADPTWVT